MKHVSNKLAMQCALRDIAEHNMKDERLKKKNHRMNVPVDTVRFSLAMQLSIFPTLEIVQLNKIKNY